MKTYKIVKSALFILLGASIFFLKCFYLTHIKYFIGSLIVIYSFDDLFLFIFEKEKAKKIHLLCYTIVQFLIGVFIFLFVDKASTICVIWGCWAILREADELKECYSLFKERTPFLLNLAESIVAIVFSIIMIVDSSAWENHATVHLYLLIVELITAVIFPEFRWIYKVYIKSQKSDFEAE